MSSPESLHPVHLSDTTESVGEIAAALEGVDRVAVDIEANGLHAYHLRVCLLQLSAAGHDYIIDPLADIDLGPVMDVLSRKTLLFHAGDFDLRMLRLSFGFKPGPLPFDTMLAVKLLGHTHVALETVLQELMQLDVPKSAQKSNWMQRPLTESQLAYAQCDTHYLEALMDICAAALERLGRTQWHRELSERMVESAMREDAPRSDDAWRIRGAGRLSRKEQHFLRAIWQWREVEASRSDIPSFKVLDNRRMTEIAIWNANGQTTRQPSLPRSCVGRRRRAYDEALDAAHAAPEKDWPQRPVLEEKPLPVDKRRVDQLKDAAAKRAEELGVPGPVLINRAALETIVRELPEKEADLIARCGLMTWQAELLAPVLLPVLHGA